MERETIKSRKFCIAMPSSGQIITAGDGSRHTLFCTGRSRMSSIEKYDMVKDEWVEMDELPRYRVRRLVEFLVGSDEGEEFWVMGYYRGRRRGILDGELGFLLRLRVAVV